MEIHDWSIEYWGTAENQNPIKEWLESLPHEHLISIARELQLLKTAGNEIKLPHSKALGDGLFELRERHYGLRIYYSYEKHCVITLLAAGNKASQEHDINIARNRLIQDKII